MSYARVRMDNGDTFHVPAPTGAVVGDYKRVISLDGKPLPPEQRWWITGVRGKSPAHKREVLILTDHVASVEIVEAPDG